MGNNSSNDGGSNTQNNPRQGQNLSRNNGGDSGVGRSPPPQQQEPSDISEETAQKGKGVNKKALAIALGVLSAAVVLGLVGYCCCVARNNGRSCWRRQEDSNLMSPADVPAFAGPLRRIIVDSQGKGSGPGVTNPLQAYYNPFTADQDLHFASAGQSLDTMQARKPKHVAKGYHNQLTGQPIKSILKNWEPLEE
jgi:hypothetical protein